jgi:hypothetical protein
MGSKINVNKVVFWFPHEILNHYNCNNCKKKATEEKIVQLKVFGNLIKIYQK